jgi:hypothetical protein
MLLKKFSMKKINLCLLLMLSFGILHAQTIVSLNQTLGYGQSHAIFAFNDRYDGLEGNPYFFDDKYHDGELWLTKNRHYTTEYKYKFDQLTRSVLVQSADGKDVVMDGRDVLTFQLFIDDKKVTFVSLALAKNEDPAIVQVIYWSPKMKLIRDIRKKLLRNRENGAYNDGKVTDKVVNDYRYYFAKNDEPLESIKPNKKGFIRVFPNKESEIERLFKTKEFKDELTISKLAELMEKLDADK